MTVSKNSGGNCLLANLLSIIDLLSVYNNIAKATELAQKSDYHLFKAGVRPEWEDKQNQKGGKWAFQSKGASKEHLDDMWLYSVRFLWHKIWSDCIDVSRYRRDLRKRERQRSYGCRGQFTKGSLENISLDTNDDESRGIDGGRTTIQGDTATPCKRDAGFR